MLGYLNDDRKREFDMTKLEEHLAMTKLTKMDEMTLMMEQLAGDVRLLSSALQDAVTTVERLTAVDVVNNK
jgi:hypothetical protein